MRKSLENQLFTTRHQYDHLSNVIKTLEEELDSHLMHFERSHGNFLRFLKETRDIVDKCVEKMGVIDSIIEQSTNKNR